MTPILGIDPGLSGALALFTPATQHLRLYAMPTHTRTTHTGTKKKRLDCKAVVDWLNLFVPTDTSVFLEDPHARPGQGVTSMFSFGRICGQLEMAITASNLRLTLVAPQHWKKALHLSADKDHARQRASQLFPAFAGQWALKSQDGLAEAVLLAYYGSTRGGSGGQ